MNSSYYKSKIDLLSSFLDIISPASSKVSNALDDITDLNKYTSDVIINGQGINQDSLKNNAVPTLAKTNSHISLVINRCNQKIEEYKILYQEALAREEAARRAQEEAERQAQYNKSDDYNHTTSNRTTSNTRRINMLK